MAASIHGLACRGVRIAAWTICEGKIGDVGLTAEWTLRVIASAWAASTVDMPPSQSR
jgi:hypothetical protein